MSTFSWTKKQREKLEKVQEVLDELADYMPLTLRQVYYQLVGKGYIENNVSQYIMLSKLIKWARIDGYIDWASIEDRTRNYNDLTGYDNKKHFIESELHYFLNGYSRNLLQSQDVYLELWVEKDALKTLFIKAAKPYRVPVTVCRGFSSISFLHNFTERIYRTKDKQNIMLYFGDFDPSGMEMLEATKRTLLEEMGVECDISFERIALKLSDISKYKLPHDPSALKQKDTRAKKYVNKYGELAVELDALRPNVLESKIVKAIESKIDIDLYLKEKRKEVKDITEINILKKKTEEFLLEGE